MVCQNQFFVSIFEKTSFCSVFGFVGLFNKVFFWRVCPTFVKVLFSKKKMKGGVTLRMLDFGQLDFGQLAEVEIGRSRNWPKSNNTFWCFMSVALVHIFMDFRVVEVRCCVLLCGVWCVVCRVCVVCGVLCVCCVLCFVRSRRGFTPQPEISKRAHLRAPALQTPPKFHEKTPREERMKFPT